MNEDKQWELCLFQILRVKGNIYYLVDEKHSYTDVVVKIAELRGQGLIDKADDNLELTNAGIKYFHQLSRSLGKKGLYKYFMEANDYKTTTITTEEIYIPRKRLNLE